MSHSFRVLPNIQEFDFIQGASDFAFLYPEISFSGTLSTCTFHWVIETRAASKFKSHDQQWLQWMAELD